MPSRSIIAGALMLIPASASATGETERLITENDRARPAPFNAAKANALKEALAGGTEQDIWTLDRILARPAPRYESKLDILEFRR